MSIRWITANWQSKAMTCAYCHKAILPGQQYRHSKTDRTDFHKLCYEVK